LWELVANALEHSGAHALLMGQVYLDGERPDHHRRVQIAIGDAGRGIRASFLESGTRSPANDTEAIELALQYLVSSVADPGRGQGLTTTVEQATALEGHVVVRSGDARVTVDGSGSRSEQVQPIDGTVVGVSLPLYPGSS
ncbi:MAG: ATP-binding protein, partial [Actinobacteria bacterium]|nr:ATP-binding protein [Actinomycetota bacterium]